MCHRLLPLLDGSDVRIVTEKEPCFFGTMINNRPPRRFLVIISRQCFSNDAGVLKNKSISL